MTPVCPYALTADIRADISRQAWVLKGRESANDDPHGRRAKAMIRRKREQSLPSHQLPRDQRLHHRTSPQLQHAAPDPGTRSRQSACHPAVKVELTRLGSGRGTGDGEGDGDPDARPEEDTKPYHTEPTPMLYRTNTPSPGSVPRPAGTQDTMK